MDPLTLVDTARHPLHALEGSAGVALMESCRRRMRAEGVCRLPAFLSSAGLEMLRHEARALRVHAHHSEVYYTPWYAKPDSSLPEGDPRAAALAFSVGYVGRDRLPAAGAIETLFGWEPLLALVQAALGSGSIYRFDDSLGSLNVTVMGRGEALGWHFDACEAVVSVLLEAAEAGGRFEYVRLSSAPKRKSAPGWPGCFETMERTRWRCRWSPATSSSSAAAIPCTG